MHTQRLADTTKTRPMKEKTPPPAASSNLKQEALESWENEGGEVPDVQSPRAAEISAGTGARKKRHHPRSGA
jgi:hypothetical protein